MELNRDQENQIERHRTTIEKVGSCQLEEFLQKWHAAKQDLDPLVFNEVLDLADARSKELEQQDVCGQEVEASEVKAGDF